jgi:hypothetical protein
MDEPNGASREERIRDAITLAKNMRNNGASPEAIAARLARRGFDKPAIEAIMSHVPSEEPDNIILRRDPTTGFRAGLVVVGLIVSGLGAVLVIGNRTGAAPTVPLLGFMVMVVGGVIMALGRS